MVRMYTYNRLDDSPRLLEWERKRWEQGFRRLSESLYWMELANRTLGHRCYYITLVSEEEILGVVPIAEVRGLTLGAFLISMPYVSWSALWAKTESVKDQLLAAAIQLAEKRKAHYLEIRGDINSADKRWIKRCGHKVVMLRELPERAEELWRDLASKVRNQVRKAEKAGFRVVIACEQGIGDFYRIYQRNMQWLGTPAYPRSFVKGIGEYFADRCEVVLVYQNKKAVAGGVMLHGNGITEVPLAACLPEYRTSCANMLLYWELLRRSVQRKSRIFDFGRCTPTSGSYHFKKQWGAVPQELVWHYYLRDENPSKWAKEHPRFALWQKLWKRLPGAVAEMLGAYIIRRLPV